ncbi:LysM peptidoglycan-binding domain-containing protein [Actinomyces graevenitzii]|uniref:LysM peptidoglycan-binding domain-containing protein n=1 Tax=Actinomyces graevenitzii TaxID=55565 RepID=UPI0012DEED01|nr:LysM peptidoglycan-binding domain-containing protein [Actinomyces graevenitzii]
MALLRPLSLQYLSLWSMADVSTALAGLAAGAGAALVAWHALGAMWVLVCACTHRTLNLRHSAPLVRKLATGAAIIALSCAPASANDDNLGWGAHGPGPSPSATASTSASARPSTSAKPSASAKASAPATASSPSRSPHASSAPTSRASATPTSHASARARASASASASPRPSARPSASPSRSSAHPRSGGPGSKTPAVKSPGAKSPNSKANPKSGSLKPGSAQRSGTCVPAPDAKPAPVIRQHLVLAGESLWSISLQWLQQNGVPSPTNGQVAQLSKQIFAANAALIGANPDLIRPGLALTIPTKG